MTSSPGTRLARTEFERELAQFINGTLLGGSGTATRDTRLFEDGIINSLRILDLIAFVERTLGAKVPDRAVRLANFRSIAAIADAFHPEGSGRRPEPGGGGSGRQPQSRDDGLFSRRTDRSRFGSPIEALISRGELTVSAAGQVGLSGIALDLLHAVDDTVLGWARELGAVEHRYPSLIDLATLERAGYPESFPQHLTLVTRLEPAGSSRGAAPPPLSSRGAAATRDLPDRAHGQTGHEDRNPAPSSPSLSLGLARDDSGVGYALAPAVCYHCYPEWQGRTLGDEPALLTACGRCYRFEGDAHAPLERMWDFTMREVVVFGTRDQVEDARRTFIDRAAALVNELELDGALESATDPFFGGAAERRRIMQKAAALKYELLLTVESSGRAIAVASFNHHHDFFGERFDIRRSDGEPAHSGCVAFGLERWVLAILAQHGAELAGWPAPLRAWLERERSGGRA